MVAIIDDREDVWNYSSNVIAVLPYKFFKGCSRVHIVLVDHLYPSFTLTVPHAVTAYFSHFC